MRWSVVRRVPLADINKRIEEVENKYGGNMVGLHDDFIAGRLQREAFEDFVEWSSMNHALRAYSEGEDFEYYAEVDLDLSRESYKKMTLRRLELLDELGKGRFSSINEMATRVRRDVKNVYMDLKIMEKLGFIQLIREGRRLVPELLVQEITIEFG